MQDGRYRVGQAKRSRVAIAFVTRAAASSRSFRRRSHGPTPRRARRRVLSSSPNITLRKRGFQAWASPPPSGGQPPARLFISCQATTMSAHDAYRDGDYARLHPSAVLFLDVLGTVAFGSAGDAHARLAKTLEALELARDWGDSDPIDTPAVARWFSDNLGMAYPILGAVEEEDALGAIVLAAGHHQLALIVNGFTARGAISLGLFYADDFVIYGPALNAAVALEQETALYPRVVLDEASVNACRRHLIDYYGGSATAPNRSCLAVDREGVTFVNYLGCGLEFDEEQRPLSLRYLGQHRDFIRERLALNAESERILQKYMWMAAYHDWFVGELSAGDRDDGLRNLLIEPAVELDPGFVAFGDDIPIPANPWANGE